LANTGFQTVYNNIGLDWTYRVKLCIGNLGKWNSVKWNETRRIGAIFASFESRGFVSVSWAFLFYLVVFISTLPFKCKEVSFNFVYSVGQDSAGTSDNWAVLNDYNVYMRLNNMYSLFVFVLLLCILYLKFRVAACVMKIYGILARRSISIR